MCVCISWQKKWKFSLFIYMNMAWAWITVNQCWYMVEMWHETHCSRSLFSIHLHFLQAFSILPTITNKTKSSPLFPLFSTLSLFYYLFGKDLFIFQTTTTTINKYNLATTIKNKHEQWMCGMNACKTPVKKNYLFEVIHKSIVQRNTQKTININIQHYRWIFRQWCEPISFEPKWVNKR